MQTSYLFFYESFEKKIFYAVYKIVITESKQEEPTYSFLSEKEVATNIVLETQYFKAQPLTDSHALTFIQKHFDDKGYMKRTLHTNELLETCRAIIDNEFLHESKRERHLGIYIKEQFICNIAFTKFEILANPYCELSKPEILKLFL